MEGDVRRTQIIQYLEQAETPVSGTSLAKKMGVSRQVIVQDIALLRAVNKNILSTNKGYLLYQEQEKNSKKRRTFKVKHDNAHIMDELNTIVDLGGQVLDVVVEHDIYGQITVDLVMNSRADVAAFVDKVNKNRTRPLNELTEGVHFHTVQASSEGILDRIEEALFQKGYLLK